jgi:hypothetical protein
MSLVFQNIDPHPPLRPVSVYPPPLLGGEGSGGSIFWKTRDIGLPFYSNNLSTVAAMFAGKVMAVFYSLFYRVVLPYITIIASNK